MPRSTRNRLFTILAVLFGVLGGYLLISSTQPARSASGGSHADIEAFEPYLHYLHEFTERRRVNVYFKNEQSIFYGAQVNFVNTDRGNLTFLRRDLVTGGRVPLMVARVYDSSGFGSEEFGAGWHLSAAETIEIQNDTARLRSETGAVIRFQRSGNSFVLEQDYPSDYTVLNEAATGGLTLRLRSGHTKEFTLLGTAYRLTRVTDRNGNEARLVYEGTKLKRLESSGHLIEFVRRADGRIASVRDEANRTVRYLYDNRGMLSSAVDVAGNRWIYQYSGQRRLHKADDPLGRETFKVWYAADGRVRALDLPSGRVSYNYDDGLRSTTVKSRKGLETQFFHNEHGITTRVINPLGQETRITLDDRRNVTEVWEAGSLLHQMEYDQEHRLVSRRSGQVTARYSYDASNGEVARIERSDGKTVALAYDARGNLVRVADREGVRTYQYSALGGVIGVTGVGGAHAVQFQVNADGLIMQMIEDGGSRTSFSYDPHGRLAEASFADGLTSSMQYDPLGLRRELKYSDGRRVEYAYDPAGNLVRIDLHKLDGTRGGQVLELDESYQVRRQIMADGREVRLDYDKHGNLLESREGERVLRFEYDSLDRLTAVVAPSGQRLEYHYAPGESSLVAQHGGYAEAVVSPRRDSGLTFSASWEVFSTRADASQFGSVRFDEKLGRFQLSGSSGYEVSTRADEAEGPLARLRLVADGTPLHERQRAFQAPSNPMYLPAEYAAINCCPICATGPDHPPCEPCFEDPPPPPPPDPVPSATMQVKFSGSKTPGNNLTFPSQTCSQSLGLFNCPGRGTWVWNVEIKADVTDDASKWTPQQSYTGRKKGFSKDSSGVLHSFDVPLNVPDDSPDSQFVQKPAGQKILFWLDAPGHFYRLDNGQMIDSMTQVQNFTSTICSTVSSGTCVTTTWHFKLVIKPGSVLDTANSTAGNGSLSTNF